MREAESSVREIEVVMACSEKTVPKWIAHIGELDPVFADHRRQNKRPRETNNITDQRIVEHFHNENPFDSVSRCARDVNEEISARKIRRRLHEDGLRNCRPVRKCEFSQRNREECIGHALQYIQQPANFWTDAVFMDEKCFSTDEDERVKVWRPLNG